MCVCVCVRQCPFECSVIIVYKWQRMMKVYFVERSRSERDSAGHTEAERKESRSEERIMFSGCYGMCRVHFGVCSERLHY